MRQMMSSAARSDSPTEAPPKEISLTYSLADQSFVRTKSVGIFNVSLDLLRVLARRPELPRLMVLANSSVREKLKLPATSRAQIHDVAVRGILGRMWWDQFAAYAAARRSGNEWLLLPKGFASFARRCPVRLAPLIHDVVQDHYDRHYPGEGSRFEAAYFRAAFRASLRQADVIFTPTQFTSREVARVAREKAWPFLLWSAAAKASTGRPRRPSQNAAMSLCWPAAFHTSSPSGLWIFFRAGAGTISPAIPFTGSVRFRPNWNCPASLDSDGTRAWRKQNSAS